MEVRNVPFRLESRIYKAWFRVTGLRPSSAPFVSGDSFRAIADHVLEPGTNVMPDRIGAGDIVFVQSSELGRFTSAILPQVEKAFVLITHNGDLNIDGSFLGIASNPFLLRWFAQNAVISHPRITGIPIGLENRNLHENGIVNDFMRLEKRASSKAMKVLSAFSVGTNPSERRYAREVLQKSEVVDAPRRINSRAYRKALMGYAFIASPPGNGVDCHRTWEALYLGVVPIVRKSAFYEYFPGLPVVAVEDWKEVSTWTHEHLRSLYDELSPRIRETPYVRFSYWADLIQKARDPSTRSRFR
jgi:hypothetical protein